MDLLEVAWLIWLTGSNSQRERVNNRIYLSVALDA